MTRPILPALALAFALSATACGSGGGDDTASPDRPATAAAPADATPDGVREAIDAGPAADDVLSGNPETIERPPAGTPTPQLAEGADITYACEDGGDLRVGYAANVASVTLPDGAIATLPLSPSASAGSDGEVYVGETLALQRLGSVVELQAGDGEVRRCRETSASA